MGADRMWPVGQPVTQVRAMVAVVCGGGQSPQRRGLSEPEVAPAGVGQECRVDTAGGGEERGGQGPHWARPGARGLGALGVPPGSRRGLRPPLRVRGGTELSLGVSLLRRKDVKPSNRLFPGETTGKRTSPQPRAPAAGCPGNSACPPSPSPHPSASQEHVPFEADKRAVVFVTPRGFYLSPVSAPGGRQAPRRQRQPVLPTCTQALQGHAPQW